MKQILMNKKWKLWLPEMRMSLDWDNWEFERLEKMNEVIKPGDTILDVGTEMGDISALLASWAGENGRIALIEPSERYWPHIRDIWQANNLKQPVINYVGMMTEKRREVVLSGEWPKECDGEKTTVEGFKLLSDDVNDTYPKTTLDYIAEKVGKVDVVTMDVEGSELYVLQGMSNLLANQKPIVFISLHPRFMKDSYGYSVEEIFYLMGKYDYKGTFLAFDHEFHFMFKTV